MKQQQGRYTDTDTDKVGVDDVVMIVVTDGRQSKRERNPRYQKSKNENMIQPYRTKGMLNDTYSHEEGILEKEFRKE